MFLQCCLVINQVKMAIGTAKQLEETAHEAARSKPFTRIRGQPSRKARKNLEAEASEVAMGTDVSCNWSGDFGLSAEAVGAEKHQEETGRAHSEPTQPDTCDSQITKDTTAFEREKMAALHEKSRENRCI